MEGRKEEYEKMMAKLGVKLSEKQKSIIEPEKIVKAVMSP